MTVKDLATLKYMHGVLCENKEELVREMEKYGWPVVFEITEDKKGHRWIFQSREDIEKLLSLIDDKIKNL